MYLVQILVNFVLTVYCMMYFFHINFCCCTGIQELIFKILQQVGEMVLPSMLLSISTGTKELIEQVLIEYCKTKTKVITLGN